MADLGEPAAVRRSVACLTGSVHGGDIMASPASGGECSEASCNDPEASRLPREGGTIRILNCAEDD
jgi:hypothetical protein